MTYVERWYATLTPQAKLKFAALTALYGQERIADALCDINDIDQLFDLIAQRVYGAN
ncbi:hypothetical protein [Alicyclobacillus acidoterrestris]|uniref:Uncharacterized protein n=1 Tax=Alicyclobacillus acidoterrestris (strain ATCC 49025 / DSM 3922 / CIP 106132 / NCIMB 13137 / GD3B) TaxID=1356854 RepID=T0BUD1_ALIAG|nr:hypothetical protein [Alicyclobacillus acidoterrestris]EPZ47698.1 hypothetical protein N007_05440 [Alicyclobacillus acidoterrestris ATCC 49025]UNO47987.1 hypothetical protein K1I37_15035 [Alicyclobacillus acidoterrestris]